MEILPTAVLYFIIHLALVIICACIHALHPKTGSLLFSFVPSFSMVSIFTHFVFYFVSKLETNFINKIKYRDIHMNYQQKKIIDEQKAQKTNNLKNCYFFIGIFMFVLVFFATIFVLKINCRLHSIGKNKTVWLSDILQFPFKHSFRPKPRNSREEFEMKYDYNTSFSAVIIAPMVEEIFKYTFIMLSIVVVKFFKKYDVIRNNFSSGSNRNSRRNSYYDIQYCYHMKCLMFTFIAVCIGGGLAMYENFGYLLFCEWAHFSKRKLWNERMCFKQIDSTNDGNWAGISRGMFGATFHCMTAIIIVNIFYWWMIKFPVKYKTKYKIKLRLFWLMLSFPICISPSIFLHASYNYWAQLGIGLAELIWAITTVIVLVVLYRNVYFIQLYYEWKAKESTKCNSEKLQIIRIE